MATRAELNALLGDRPIVRDSHGKETAAYTCAIGS